LAVSRPMMRSVRSSRAEIWMGMMGKSGLQTAGCSWLSDAGATLFYRGSGRNLGERANTVVSADTP
jgi:hypothetical protein